MGREWTSGKSNYRNIFTCCGGVGGARELELVDGIEGDGGTIPLSFTATAKVIQFGQTEVVK